MLLFLLSGANPSICWISLLLLLMVLLIILVTEALFPLATVGLFANGTLILVLVHHLAILWSLW